MLANDVNSSSEFIALKNWKHLQISLSQDLSRCSFEEVHVILSDLQSALDENFSGGQMLLLVVDITREYAAAPELAVQSFFTVFNCYRKVQNIFRFAPDMMRALYFPHPYLKLVADSVLSVGCSPDLRGAERRALGTLLDRGGVEARRALTYSLFCSTLCSQSSCPSPLPRGDFLRCLSQSSLLEMLTLALHSASLLHMPAAAVPRDAAIPDSFELLRVLMSITLYGDYDNANSSDDDGADDSRGQESREPNNSASIHVRLSLSPMEVAEVVFLRGAALTGSAVRVLVECFRRPSTAGEGSDDLLEFAELLAGSVWGEAAFVARSNAALQASLTFSLLTALRRVRGDLEQKGAATGIFPASLLALLARGVGVYIDSPDSLTRLQGMRVAVEFSLLMALRGRLAGQEGGGQGAGAGAGEIVFEELQRYEEDCEGRLVLALQAPVPPLALQSERHRSSDSGSDSDSDGSEAGEEGLEAYFLDEVQGRRAPSSSTGMGPTSSAGAGAASEEEDLISVHYLRQALSLLQFTDSSSPDGSYANHKSVLTALPRLVLALPADGADLTAPLLRELLRMSNSFNMPHFDELRGASMQALVAAHPARAVEVLVWAAGSDTLSVGVRLEALVAMVDGAYSLAGLRRPSSPSPVTQSPRQVDDLSDLDGEELQGNAQRSLAANDSKVIMKRPLRLAAMRREKNLKSHKNAFGDLAMSFFQPVLALLAAQLQRLEERVAAAVTGTAEALDALLPAQCLLSLGAFVRCAVHTASQRHMLQALLAAAFPLRDSASLHLRRAAAAVLFDCTGALFASLAAAAGAIVSRSPRGTQQFGTLGFLMNLAPPELIAEEASLTGSGSSSLSFGALAAPLRDLVTGAVQWAASTAQHEQDSHCRVLQVEIVRTAVAYFD